MEHISRILSGGSASAPWQQAAEAAHTIARTQSDHPASLRQLRRICQLLTSHTLEERERRRAFVLLTRGCTQEEASAMLDYLIPRVQARKTSDARALLDALLATGSSGRSTDGPDEHR